MCELRTFALVVSCAARSRFSSAFPVLYVVRAEGEKTPPKLITLSTSVLGDTSPAWMLFVPRGLAQLNAEGVVALLLDNEGNNTASFHTRLIAVPRRRVPRYTV